MKKFLFVAVMACVCMVFASCSEDNTVKRSAVASVTRTAGRVYIELEDGHGVNMADRDEEWLNNIAPGDTLDYIKHSDTSELLRWAKEQPKEVLTTVSGLKKKDDVLEITFDNGSKFAAERGSWYEKNLSVGDTVRYTYYRGQAKVTACGKES